MVGSGRLHHSRLFKIEFVLSGKRSRDNRSVGLFVDHPAAIQSRSYGVSPPHRQLTWRVTELVPYEVKVSAEEAGFRSR